MAPLLPAGARPAWRRWSDAALAGAEPFGPLDVQSRNVVASGERGVVFLDFATVGRASREKRLAAYAQSFRPEPRTLLVPEAYAAFRREAGEEAALRLAFYDFLFFGLAYARAVAAGEAPGAGRAAAAGFVRAWTR